MKSTFKFILILSSSLLITIENCNAQSDICAVIPNDLTEVQARKLSVTELVRKNKIAYEEFKDDVSKKIKLSSNILVLTAKLESLSLKIQELNELCKTKGCQICPKPTEN